ncbi:MAG: 50S ribosomal protein L6 [Candidatus Sungbacteria bacterium]|nr:50S ribosomal protein L6 [bacterium]MDZ4260442.1 50S ribosomal protein L6 [Candidatus Sungbacteria bacterium]
MSRIGKKSIIIPSGVTVNLVGDILSVKGPKGELKLTVHSDMIVEITEKNIVISPRKHASKKAPAIWGLMRTLIDNRVNGVVSGFEKVLEFEGIGFRAALEGSTLVMQLGFSHPVRFEPPQGITFAVLKNTITISGIDKELVGQVAARIRALKKPEPYKGKGIRYRGEVIRRKAGKKAVASGG